MIYINKLNSLGYLFPAAWMLKYFDKNGLPMGKPRGLTNKIFNNTCGKYKGIVIRRKKCLDEAS
uniref:Uncharacterized protein n=1 Tax=viral metagenome TaxID=1070528 RepID=A0A6M3K6Z1_9ZZZZ